MVLKLKSVFTQAFQTFKEAVTTLLNEKSKRAEFQSSVGLFLMFCWLTFISNPEPVVYIHGIEKFMSHQFLGNLLFLIAIFQTYSNMGYHPKERLMSSLLACLAWCTILIIGLFTSFNFLVVPLSFTFALTQALVFIHLEQVEE